MLTPSHFTPFWVFGFFWTVPFSPPSENGQKGFGWRRNCFVVGLFSPGDNASVLLSNFFFFTTIFFPPPFFFPSQQLFLKYLLILVFKQTKNIFKSFEWGYFFPNRIKMEEGKRKRTLPGGKCFRVGWDFMPPFPSKPGIGFMALLWVISFLHTPLKMFASASRGDASHESDMPSSWGWLQRCALPPTHRNNLLGFMGLGDCVAPFQATESVQTLGFLAGSVVRGHGEMVSS